MKIKIAILMLAVSVFVYSGIVRADDMEETKVEAWNTYLDYCFPPVLTTAEYEEFRAHYSDLAVFFQEMKTLEGANKDFFEKYIPSIMEGEYYSIRLMKANEDFFNKLVHAFEELGYTKEQHDEDIQKYRISYIPTPATTTTAFPVEELYGTKEHPLIVNFSVPTIYEATSLEYAVSEKSRGKYIQLELVHPKKEKNEEILFGRGGKLTPEEYPGISRYYLSQVGLPIMVHDPKKVFGYEWFWIGGREQTVYNGMNEDPNTFLSSLKRGQLKITIGQGCIDSDFMGLEGYLVLEEKTTGLFYQIDLRRLNEATEIYLDVPASEYFVTMDMKLIGDEAEDIPFYPIIGENGSTDTSFIGLIDNEYCSFYYKYKTSSPKVTIKSGETSDIAIDIERLEELASGTSGVCEKVKEAAAHNSEFVVYDYIHADKLLPEQSSYSIYKLAKAYGKDVPEGYYKQYLTSFEYTHVNTLLPIDVKTDVAVSVEENGCACANGEYYGDYFVRGSVYTNGDKTKQMFYVYGHASAVAGPNTRSEQQKDLFFAYPMDTATRICGEMISAYDNPEKFGYKKGDLDEREYAFQVLRCCVDLYQYDAQANGGGCGLRMRFRSHMEKDPSSISGEKMVYDRTVCQYLPESVIKHISYAEGIGVLIERDHSTPENSSSLWWEPLKKEPLGEIRLTEKDNVTITWPEYKEPVVERKDGSEPTQPVSTEEQSSIDETKTSEEITSTSESRELKTMEYVEKEPSSFNPATLVIIIIISVFALAAIIGAVVVIKAKKKGN